MLFNEEFTQGENSEPKKIGGINVDQSEVRRAKKCKFFFLYIKMTCFESTIFIKSSNC
jgi:hypothetical protein